MSSVSGPPPMFARQCPRARSRRPAAWLVKLAGSWGDRCADAVRLGACRGVYHSRGRPCRRTSRGCHPRPPAVPDRTPTLTSASAVPLRSSRPSVSNNQVMLPSVTPFGQAPWRCCFSSCCRRTLRRTRWARTCHRRTAGRGCWPAGPDGTSSRPWRRRARRPAASPAVTRSDGSCPCRPAVDRPSPPWRTSTNAPLRLNA